MKKGRPKKESDRGEGFALDKRITSIPASAEVSLEKFLRDVEIIEVDKKTLPIVFQDKKSGAFYIECHILASVAEPLLDTDAVLDPEEQVQYRANRTLQPQHRAFQQMMKDAELGRQFSDLVAEYNTSYKSARPIKILGGQHRVSAISNALEKKIDRPHGFRIYFDLNEIQRNEIAQISNTNIAIPVDLLDRMQETILKSGLRAWCQKVGLLKKNEDFADKKNPEGDITVRVARSFVVNFFDGKKMRYDSEKLYEPHLCSAGSSEIDPKYRNLVETEKNRLWLDNDLIGAGEAFASLHKRQKEAIAADKSLSKYAEFRTKAITPAVVSAWALLAGALSKTDKKKQVKLFNLSKIPGGDPLNASGLSKAKHHTDPDTYRGVGTRTDKKERARIAEVFIQFIESSQNVIKTKIIDLALKSYHAKIATQDVENARKKI